jgi:hypothetical protein
MRKASSFAEGGQNIAGFITLFFMREVDARKRKT